MQPHAQAALRRLWLKQEQTRCQQLGQDRPDDVEVWRRLARACWELDEAAPALAALDRALALQPDDRESLLGRVVACLALDRAEEALAAAVRLVELFPDYVDAGLQQIEALRRLGRWAEAVQACERVLALPGLALQQRLKVFHDQATFQFQLNCWEDSLATVEQALALVPNDAGLRLNRARLLYRLRRLAEALDVVEPLTGLPAVRLVALCVKTRTLAASRRFDEADALLQILQRDYPREALDREFAPGRLPDEAPADSLRKRFTARGLYSAQILDAQQECDWTDWDPFSAEIGELAQDAIRYGFVFGLEPHRLLSLPLDPALQLAVARAQAMATDALMAPIRQNLRIEWRPHQPGERLRIGYVSGDFRNHATAHLIRKLFQSHDRTRFEIIGYSLRPGDGSRYWRDISENCDRFVDLFGLSNAEAAARIAQDGVQVLVDLQGYTRFARPEIFALRPAPVQVAFLGYPGTTGADYIPYIIADRVVLPEALRPCFSEQPVYLPDCYQINDDEQLIAETGTSRTTVGLPEQGFVYCCFNTAYKIEPGVFGAWMRILRQIPNSVLWLLADTPRCAAHLRAAARERGVDPARLVFAPRLPKAEHLERHRLADLFLDTVVVNAHTTASDALWTGLPVLTLRGETFQSRVCASLLTALGLLELIVDSAAQYEALAVDLAREPERLQAWRARLQARRGGPPFNTRGFVRGLERAFAAMWSLHQAGRMPDMLYIQKDSPIVAMA